MPSKFMRRRMPARKYKKRSKVVTKVWGAKRFRVKPRHGGFSVARKLPVITLQSTAVAGLAAITDPTGTCLQIGTPSASPGSSTTYDIPFSLKFSLNQLLSFTDITQIADQYKIKSVMVKLSSAYQTATGLATAVPHVEYIQDYDDANVPSLSAIRTKMGVRTKYFGPTRNSVTMGVRPRFADEVYNNGVTTAYAIGRRGWVNCDYPAVEHYSIKGVLHNVALPAVANNATMTFDITAFVAAKDLQ